MITHDDVLDALRSMDCDVQRRFSHHSATCPTECGNQLTIKENVDGTPKLNCFGDCSEDEIYSALGLGGQTQTGDQGSSRTAHASHDGDGGTPSNGPHQSRTEPISDSSWQDPVPLRMDKKPPDFPLDTAFPSSLTAIRDYIAAVAESTQVAIDVPAMLLPPIVSLCIAGKFEIRTAPGYTEISAIWTLTLLKSGNRKSSTHKRMLKPIHQWERDENQRLGPIIAEQEEQRKIDEHRQKELRQTAAKPSRTDEAESAREEAVELAQRLSTDTPTSVPQLVTIEPTTEAVGRLLMDNSERLLVSSSEADSIDVMLGRYSKGVPNFGLYLAGHSGDPYRSDRVGRSPVHLDRPVLSVALTVQPDAVMGAFQNRQARGRGYLARFFYSVPESLLGRRKTNPAPVPLELEDRYAQALRRLLDLPIPECPAIVDMTPEAAKLYYGFQEQLEPELGDKGGLADRTEWAGKLCGGIARIALGLHILDMCGFNSARSTNSALHVGAEAMHAALAWAPYLIDHEQIAAGVVGTDLDTVIAERVLKWIKDRGIETFRFQEAFSACRSEQARKAEDFRPAFGLLEQHVYVRAVEPPQRSGPRLGRSPSPTYVVNPTWLSGEGRGSR